LSSPTVSTKLARIAEQSKRDATWVFTTLAHLMDEDFLTEAFHQLRKDAAAGIDEMTATEYAVNLGERITDLHRRMVAWEYRAQPARRVWIPKGDGGQRPLAILFAPRQAGGTPPGSESGACGQKGNPGTRESLPSPWEQSPEQG